MTFLFRKVLALDAKKEKLISVEKNKVRLNELGWILFWLPVRDADRVRIFGLLFVCVDFVVFLKKSTLSLVFESELL